MRTVAALFVLALLAIVPAAAVQNQPAVEPGFTSLFNGTDFTGWRLANPDAFSIRDGVIVANGTPGHAYYEGPVGNHAFRNFELKVDVMTEPSTRTRAGPRRDSKSRSTTRTRVTRSAPAACTRSSTSRRRPRRTTRGSRRRSRCRAT